MRVISRKYNKEHYIGKIVDSNNIQYKGQNYPSYDAFYKAITPNTNSHFEGDGMHVFISNSDKWVRLLDL